MQLKKLPIRLKSVFIQVPMHHSFYMKMKMILIIMSQGKYSTIAMNWNEAEKTLDNWGQEG